MFHNVESRQYCFVSVFVKKEHVKMNTNFSMNTSCRAQIV